MNVLKAQRRMVNKEREKQLSLEKTIHKENMARIEGTAYISPNLPLEEIRRVALLWKEAKSDEEEKVRRYIARKRLLFNRGLLFLVTLCLSPPQRHPSYLLQRKVRRVVRDPHHPCHVLLMYSFSRDSCFSRSLLVHLFPPGFHHVPLLPRPLHLRAVRCMIPLLSPEPPLSLSNLIFLRRAFSIILLAIHLRHLSLAAGTTIPQKKTILAFWWRIG